MWCLLFQVISKDVISVLSREDVVLMTVTNFATVVNWLKKFKKKSDMQHYILYCPSHDTSDFVAQWQRVRLQIERLGVRFPPGSHLTNCFGLNKSQIKKLGWRPVASSWPGCSVARVHEPRRGESGGFPFCFCAHWQAGRHGDTESRSRVASGF